MCNALLIRSTLPFFVWPKPTYEQFYVSCYVVNRCSWAEEDVLGLVS